MKVGYRVGLKGTKSHGDSWDAFITDSHFAPRTKDDIYGVIFAIKDIDIWVHIFDKKTKKKLDESTHVFREIDLE